MNQMQMIMNKTARNIFKPWFNLFGRS